MTERAAAWDSTTTEPLAWQLGQAHLNALRTVVRAAVADALAATTPQHTRLAYTVTEVEDLTGISKETIYKLIREHRFPAIRLRGTSLMRVPAAELDRWLRLGDDWQPLGVGQ